MLKKPLIQTNKSLARAVLYLAPILFVLLAWIFIRSAKDLGIDTDWHGKDYSINEQIQLLRDYLRIDSSFPHGNEIPGAEFLARQLEAAGIPVHIERLGRRNANLWAVIEGEDRQAVVMHNHLDVEPIRPEEEWLYPPFEGVLDPPFVIGRGAFDMKSLAIAQLSAMLEIAKKGKRPRRSLIFLATGDEERDSRLGTQRWIRDHPDWLERFGVVLTEGGAVEALSLEEIKFWGTETGQKYFVDVWVCDSRRERLEELRATILASPQGPMRNPSPEVAELLKLYGPSRELPEVQELLKSPDAIRDSPLAEGLPLRIQAMLRNEIVAFPVAQTSAEEFQLRLILHILPEVSFEEAWGELVPDDLFGYSFTVDLQLEGAQPSPRDHEIFRAIDSFMDDRMPKVPHGALFVPWSATDARFFRRAGIPSYGFSPFLILSTDAVKMKGANERIPAPAFLDGVELYQGLIERLVM